MLRICTLLPLCLALLAITGCGRRENTSDQTYSTPDRVESAVDASAVSDTLQVVEFVVMESTAELRCNVFRPARIVVEYPAAQGTKTLELDVSPPPENAPPTDNPIILEDFNTDSGGKVVIKPKG